MTETTGKARLSSWISRQFRTIAGVAISAGCLAFMMSQIDFRGVGNAIAGFNWLYLLLGLFSLAFGYGARIFRWTTMLRAIGGQTPIGRCAAAFMGSIALNNVLPARLGDIIRALVFPAALGVTRTASTGSLVLERLIDLLAILTFLAVGLATSAKMELPAGLKLSAVILSTVATIILVGVVLLSGVLAKWCRQLMLRNWGRRELLVRRVLQTLAMLFLSFEAMSRPGTLAKILFLSALAWAGEAGLFWALLDGFGFPAGAASGAVVMAITTLATLVPSSPGYVGPFHLAAYAATSLMGGSPDQAASFAVLAHAAVWLPTTAVGALAILTNPSLFAAAKLRSTGESNPDGQDKF